MEGRHPATSISPTSPEMCRHSVKIQDAGSCLICPVAASFCSQCPRVRLRGVQLPPNRPEGWRGGHEAPIALSVKCRSSACGAQHCLYLCSCPFSGLSESSSPRSPLLPPWGLLLGALGALPLSIKAKSRQRPWSSITCSLSTQVPESSPHPFDSICPHVHVGHPLNTGLCWA